LSTPEAAHLTTEDLVSEILRRCDSAVETFALDEVSDDHVGLLFSATVRLIAAKAQAGAVPQLTAGNHTISATDGLIACTAILETIGVEVFELSAWQALTNVGSQRRSAHPNERGQPR
jgi:hypothetical protein